MHDAVVGGGVLRLAKSHEIHRADDFFVVVIIQEILAILPAKGSLDHFHAALSLLLAFILSGPGLPLVKALFLFFLFFVVVVVTFTFVPH